MGDEVCYIAILGMPKSHEDEISERALERFKASEEGKAALAPPPQPRASESLCATFCRLLCGCLHGPELSAEAQAMAAAY